ncbi:MAG: DUF2169 family type VI secretion system accessory protein, partial [Dermatophilaceae bacterium]
PVPLCRQDDFFGETGRSALRYGDDFARHKPQCDVLFDACARAPGDTSVAMLLVEIEVAELRKRLRVHGPRTWERGLRGYTLSHPRPFERMPLHYGMAFGGQHEVRDGDRQFSEAHPENPAGIGWCGPGTRDRFDGAPAPCLEAPDAPLRTPQDRQRPLALSAVARNWEPRRGRAGTYDARWRAEVFPLLPTDFDDRYFQCAPDDQWIAYPRGGEPVRLLHLFADWPDLRFALPPLHDVGARVLRTDYSTESPVMQVDTLFFETEARRFSVLWRASTPIRRRLQEFDAIAIGRIDPHWWQTKSLGSDGGCAGCGDADGA